MSCIQELTASGLILQPGQLSLLCQQWEGPEAQVRGCLWPELGDSLYPASPLVMGGNRKYSKVRTLSAQGKGSTRELRGSRAVGGNEHRCVQAS